MRIIAGEYGGRPLNGLVGEDTRPTSDNIKETMFNFIGPYFEGGVVLDLYAGTGALAIEAISRGAAEAYLIDQNAVAFETINKNIEMTKAPEKFNVFKGNAANHLIMLMHKQLQFNLIFLDPPYKEQTIVSDIEWLLEHEMIAERALITCETHSSVELPEEIGDLTVYKKRHCGKTLLTIYSRGDF